MTISTATLLRHRAGGLRVLADQLESTPAMDLAAHAGVDTWRGPRPDECERLLAAARRAAAQAVHDVRVAARRLDERADEIDALERILG